MFGFFRFDILQRFYNGDWLSGPRKRTSQCRQNQSDLLLQVSLMDMTELRLEKKNKEDKELLMTTDE